MKLFDCKAQDTDLLYVLYLIVFVDADSATPRLLTTANRKVPGGIMMPFSWPFAAVVVAIGT